MSEPGDGRRGDLGPSAARGWRGLIALMPPALVVGLAVSLVGGVALSAYRTWLITHLDGWSPRWAQASVLATARWFTSALLLALGLGQLRARVDGRERALLSVATVAAALLVLRPLVNAYFEVVAPPHRAWHPELDVWITWSTFAMRAVMFAGLLGVLVTRGRHGAVAGALLATALVLELPVRGWTAVFYFASYRDHAWANATIGVGLQLVAIAALAVAAWAIARGAAPAGERPRALADGLARVEQALVARVVIAVCAALLTILAFGAHSVAVLELVVTVVPLAVLASQIAMVQGMLRAAGAAAVRGRLTWAAGLTILVSFAGWYQAIAAFQLARARWSHDHSADDRTFSAAAQAWPYLLPALGLVGLGLLLWAVDHVRRTTPSHHAPDPTVAGVWAVVGTAAALALPEILSSRRVELGDVLLVTALVAIANVVATLAVARACGKAAAALRQVPP